MQGLEAIGERVAVTNVALASLRLAVAQQMQFETLLEEVVKRQEDNFGNDSATTEERDYADKTAGKGDNKENPTGFTSTDSKAADSTAAGSKATGSTATDSTATGSTSAGSTAKEEPDEDSRGGALNIQV